MIFKRFTEKELKGIEKKLILDPLTADGVISVISSIKNSYVKENPSESMVCPLTRDGPSPLECYLNGINRHFGRALMRQNGVAEIDYSDDMKEQESLKLDLQELIFLREEGVKKENGLLDRLMRYACDFSEFLRQKKFSTALDDIMEAATIKAKYEGIKEKKYKKFFDDLYKFNFEEVNMCLSSPLRSKAMTADPKNPMTYLCLMIHATIPEVITAEIRKIVFDRNTQKVKSYRNY